VANIKLAEELETQKTNLRDVNEFLTNELKVRYGYGPELCNSVVGDGAVQQCGAIQRTLS
jgi:hypothetical protein